MPFIAAVQTTEDGQAVLECLRPMPFTTQAMTDFAARSLVRPLTVVSDGLACFLVSENASIHQRVVTGGGKAASKLPQSKAVNTVLSNLKTGLTGTYHAFKPSSSPSTPIDTSPSSSSASTVVLTCGQSWRA